MSFNVPLVEPHGHPLLRRPEELFILRRPGVSFELKAAATKVSAKGVLYLSTLRLVFVPSPGSSATFAAFDIPLSLLSNEKIKQPFFGANYLSGTVVPVEGGNLESVAEFRLYFKEGGIGTFYPLFFTLLERIRDYFAQQHHQPQPPPSAAFVAPIVQGAFVDPNDPTVIYVAQPSLPPQNFPSDVKPSAPPLQ